MTAAIFDFAAINRHLTRDPLIEAEPDPRPDVRANDGETIAEMIAWAAEDFYKSFCFNRDLAWGIKEIPPGTIITG